MPKIMRYVHGGPWHGLALYLTEGVGTLSFTVRRWTGKYDQHGFWCGTHQ